MPLPLESVCRDFKKYHKLFLNYESQIPVNIGDIFTWNGRKAAFTVVDRLNDLGIEPDIQASLVPSNPVYTSHKGVSSEFGLNGPGNAPAISFDYHTSGKYSMQACETSVETLDDLQLASDIARKEKDGTIQWNKNWIVVTSVWKADSFTKLIAGSSGASAQVSASAEAVDKAFNIADLSVGASLSFHKNMCVHEVAGRGACPFFIGKKYRKSAAGRPHMVRYGSRRVI